MGDAEGVKLLRELLVEFAVAPRMRFACSAVEVGSLRLELARGVWVANRSL